MAARDDRIYVVDRSAGEARTDVDQTGLADHPGECNEYPHTQRNIEQCQRQTAPIVDQPANHHCTAQQEDPDGGAIVQWFGAVVHLASR